MIVQSEKQGFELSNGMRIKETDSSICPDISIADLVDEVMREELTSLRCRNNSSPESESSLDKDSLEHGYNNHPPAMHSLSGYVLNGGVLVRLPLHVGGNTSLVLDHCENRFPSPNP